MAKYSILIIEDSMDSRRLLKAYLSTLEAELEVNLVPSAEEAFLISSSQKIDLLVTDYMLPGITGTDLVRRMRKRFPDLMVILITALDPENVTRDVIELNIQHFLRKPLDINEFLTAVQKCLGIGEFAGTLRPAVQATPQPFSSIETTPAQQNPAEHASVASTPEMNPNPAVAPVNPVVNIPPRVEPVPIPPAATPAMPPVQGSGFPFQRVQVPRPNTQPISPPGNVNRPPASPASATPNPVIQTTSSTPQPIKVIPRMPVPPPGQMSQSKINATNQLNSFLRELCEGLSAQTALLQDEEGEIITRVGDVPDPHIEFEWLPALRSTIKESLKAKTIIASANADSALLFRGREYDLIVDIFEGFSLILIVKVSQSRSRLWLALSQAMEAHGSLLLLLGRIGAALKEKPADLQPNIPVPPILQKAAPSIIEPKEEEHANAEDFANKLLGAQNSVNREDAEHFWDDFKENH